MHHCREYSCLVLIPPPLCSMEGRTGLVDAGKAQDADGVEVGGEDEIGNWGGRVTVEAGSWTATFSRSWCTCSWMTERGTCQVPRRRPPLNDKRTWICFVSRMFFTLCTSAAVVVPVLLVGRAAAVASCPCLSTPATAPRPAADPFKLGGVLSSSICLSTPSTHAGGTGLESSSYCLFTMGPSEAPNPAGAERGRPRSVRPTRYLRLAPPPPPSLALGRKDSGR
ncbi:hypothetical protein K438DRAFT_587887 [Mycena galopus ATCC 62051]|nr:hypothetical protein K438DRAFT_587887 [Mycena galopus ATCC 62051]